MKIALGTDHRGNEAGIRLVERLRERGHEVDVLCDLECKSTDYPHAAWAVGNAVASGEADFGMLICGSGIGMSIAANKVKGVRAALVQSPASVPRRFVGEVELDRAQSAPILAISSGPRIIAAVPALPDEKSILRVSTMLPRAEVSAEDTGIRAFLIEAETEPPRLVPLELR